ncbi:uncharacterized protein NECHADRAFT_83065 [Fusarium vanettenii 77-13-4]|uniref:Uncharacterized protein n=1 Tax=Fusarium vanettenii (strain ATCC MYA-4622 / CBS 123669 / FGSC 9596 / NRRL 45880 / 77-13-4) TaxID=660122 RepID=C7ZAY9_FUSV7|nr:uncharacterized protein NECHADRAFT_83065 [Fusarium vanettenii 77-13-4]EEU38806.1 predicted protein [Fusarium vanettenii 77-13-4]
MAMEQEHMQASRVGESGEAGEGHDGKQQEVLTKEELIPPIIRYRQSFDSSGNCSTIAVYSLKLASTTSSVESFHSALTSSPREDEDDNARSEDSSICEGQYANQPLEDAHDASQTVADPLPRPGLDMPLTRAKALETCTQPPMSSPDKDAETLNRVHRMHKRITKNISKKLTKRKEN